VKHALSFDVEEFFQVANLREQFPARDWATVPSRLDLGMTAVLDALQRHDARATFFFLGWVAERRPDLVRRCLEAGHEIASHGYAHAFLWDLGPATPTPSCGTSARRGSSRSWSAPSRRWWRPAPRVRWASGPRPSR